MGSGPVVVGDVAGIPAAQQTAPSALGTRGVQPIQTGLPAQVASVGPATHIQGTDSGGFPWWVLIPILLGLGLVAFLLVRRRPVVEVTTATASPGQRAYTGTTTSTTTAIPVAAGAGGGAAATANQVVCPNCGASNDLNENFCHDCGQDLRQAKTQMFAPVADVVDEYTPYLETQNRVDEQLEYVLSRAKVTIGTASGNDIVVDAGFNGSDTVSAVHAELRREGEGFVITDRGSETGVYVNGERVAEVALNDNDQVRIGDVQFVYRAPARP
ncbi:MAG TPA: FHA domain-containing protein [Chloroflexia bacterium]|jgi:hypothetical protein